VGGAVATKAFSGGSSQAQQQTAQPNTTSLTDAATKTAPPAVGASQSQATQQATIAAQKQRKRAASGDTLLTGKSVFTTNTPTAGLTPKTLLGGA